MLKILYFSGGHQFSQISPEIKSFYGRGKKLIHLLAGEVQFGTGETTSANLSTGEPTEAQFTGALGQGVYLDFSEVTNTKAALIYLSYLEFYFIEKCDLKKIRGRQRINLDQCTKRYFLETYWNQNTPRACYCVRLNDSF